MCQNCAPGRFIAASALPHGHNPVCGECAAGTFAGGAGQAACTACNGLTLWQDQTGQVACKAVTTCSATQYETQAPTAATDRVCASHKTCTATQWESTAAGTHHDRVCTAHTTCTAAQWQTKAAGTRHDRECATLTACHVGEWESAAPTATSDRGCNMPTTCIASEYELKAPTGFSDRVCKAYTPCTTAEWESTPRTATSDRVCTTLTTCATSAAGLTGAADEYETKARTATTDRTCAKCAAVTPACAWDERRAGCGPGPSVGTCVYDCTKGNCYVGPSPERWWKGPGSWSLARFPKYPDEIRIAAKTVMLLKPARGAGRGLLLTDGTLYVTTDLQLGARNCHGVGGPCCYHLV